MHIKSNESHIAVKGDKTGRSLQEGQFTAYASTWTRTPDCYGDVVRKGAFADTLRAWGETGDSIPILYGHNESDPDYNIGYVTEAVEDDHGLRVTGQLDIDTNPRAMQVYRLLKGHRLNQMSFGYEVIDQGPADSMAGQCNELRAVKLLEVSIVPRGANPDTSIEGVKQAPAETYTPNTSGMTSEQVKAAYAEQFQRNTTHLADAHRKLTKGVDDGSRERILDANRRILQYLEDQSPHTIFTKSAMDKQTEQAGTIRRRAQIEQRAITPEEQATLDNYELFKEFRQDLEQRARKEDEKLRRMLAASVPSDDVSIHSLTATSKAGYEETMNDNINTKAYTFARNEDNGHAMNPTLRKGRVAIRSVKESMNAAWNGHNATNATKTAPALTGSAIFPVPIINANEPIRDAADEVPPQLLEYIPAFLCQSGDYDILMEKTPDNPGSAAVVPAGQEKPTFSIGLEKQRRQLKVIAVLSDPIDKYVLLGGGEYGGLDVQEHITGRLYTEILRTLEREILTGDGSDAHLLGLDHIEGVKTQAFAGGILDTIVNGIAQIERQGITVQTIAISPADWLAVCTAKDTTGRYLTNNAIDPVNMRLWGNNVAVAAGLPEGTAWVIGSGSLQIATDATMALAWDAYGTLFKTNAVQFRLEARYSLDALKPHALCKVSLSAGK
ncbi:HK97 family phage prohead protease [Bifidobacterium dentium]|uniref:Phage prohead protease, HK97 family protein n=2 Tax=Bifidobacterium TaxID=1678 RepID=D2Q8Z9_BIFDB|nr:HK97 family phage prohead protease [Bifidobacterium dentium]ADB09285.1 phage prohead protease, HK97 family protein [Bifidobacterium dentium Bd1]EDT44349.1 phage prohead protease, HK97 family [Bifidobacterium dentium ATCC 27678]SEB72693.1 phage prohead protease, HK97 family/phage major capsid protein, HK97 family,TIGR01554 [Bifidobacterium dentium JCM 1195 = DSM 20436]VEG23256.1 phage prohead protease, HK97 family protein [Bifidobacterium dentium]BAQ26586.1 putative phage protease [Bifidobac